MSETVKYPNPLPTRFKEVAEKRQLLEEGITLTSEGYRSLDFYDITNACQAIIIERLSSEMIENWESPDLVTEYPFYQAFSETYYKAIFEAEHDNWKKLVQEVVSDRNLDVNNLSPFQAATLTLASMPGFEDMSASSQELFVELPLHAEVYEKLLREKLGDEFSEAKFYQLLEKNMPTLLKRLIALDSVIIDYYRANIMDRSLANDPKALEYLKSSLRTDLFLLNDSLQLSVNPKLIEMFKRHAKENGATEDNLGRQENRGCPFLKTSNQDELIAFAIKELIKQHQKHQLSSK